eukprot:TRINITY_DN6334_c0_g2_i4.p1 TRINITY_DN6334_c0_g2~~TRINITY_DN6334_c0_g2_i4.p1  ORF type:complete len:180 (-),score=24.38 TRINITY_DN6334_c0_g2_i4:545-1084(-)
MKTISLNTSNAGKFKEFERMFKGHGWTLNHTSIDLEEIDADPIKVVAQKATACGDNIVVEDTSLDVEGADVGVNVRWLLDNLESISGKKALFRVLLGVKIGDKVKIYKGEVQGKIVKSRGEGGFGFDPVFCADLTGKTLAESKPDTVNARALAVQNLVNGVVHSETAPITNWTGKWQEH